MRRLLRAITALTLVTGAVTAVALPASPASAASATIEFNCVQTLFGVGYDTIEDVEVTISAPTFVTAGDTIPISYELSGTAPLNGPATLTDAVVRVQAGIDLQLSGGGPVSSTSAAGADSPPTLVPAFDELPAVTPVALSLPSTGYGSGDEIQVRPGVLQLQIVSGADGIAGGSTLCTPTSTAPVLAEIQVNGAIPSNPADQCVVVTVSCDTQQILTATVEAGILSQSASQTGGNPNATTVDLGTVATSSAPQTLIAPMNTVEVTDTRGGQFGWSLTASLTGPMTSGSGGSMAQTALALTGVSCVGDASSAPSSAGPGGSLGTTQSLCQVADGAIGPHDSTGGQYAVAAGISLAVPQFQRAGSYSTVLTVTLL